MKEREERGEREAALVLVAVPTISEKPHIVFNETWFSKPVTEVR
jgi:hypothetical protein